MPNTESQTATASLPVILYERLFNASADELQSLKEAGEGHGFFYLDLTGARCSGVLEGWLQVLRFMELYFNQHLDVKMKDAKFSDTVGYEPVRTSAGAMPNSKDLYETLKISRDQIRSGTESLPSSVMPTSEIITNFILDLDSVLSTILQAFSTALKRNGQSRFECSHRPNMASRTTLSLFRYPKQTSLSEGIGHNKHTDLGTLTLLLTTQWGLQVLSPTTGQWEFIQPLPNMAIVNVGDSLRFLSGNRLKSSVHRVMPLQVLQHEHRYSIAYFLRPEDDAEYETVAGRVMTAKTWHDRKFDVFRESHSQQTKEDILTGGMERGDRLIV